MAAEKRGSCIWRKRRQKSFNDHSCRRRSSSRAMLASSQDPMLLEQLVTQNEQAELIKQLIASQKDLPLGEFASYFRGTVKNVPSCLLTSHARKRHPMIPVYPSMLQQTLKFNPFVATATTSQDFSLLESDEPIYNCRCAECTSDRCPFRTTPSTNVLKNRLFKDNIITFCNQWTMTPRVNDAACGICLGVTPITHTRDVDVSATPPQPPVKDCGSLTKVERQNRPRTPILKRPVIDSINTSCGVNRCTFESKVQECDDVYDNCWPTCAPRRTYDLCHEAVRDTDPGEYCVEPSKFRPFTIPKPCQKLNRYSDMAESMKEHDVPLAPPTNRRMLYNEGISDSMFSNYPECARKHSPADLTNPSKVSVGKCYPDLDNWIPYSHRGNSKYHEDCKKQPALHYIGAVEPEPRVAPDCPRHAALARASCKKPPPPACRPPCSSLPKRMLTSEKNIDAFIINGHKYRRVDEQD